MNTNSVLAALASARTLANSLMLSVYRHFSDKLTRRDRHKTEIECLSGPMLKRNALSALTFVRLLAQADNYSIDFKT